MTRTKVKDNPHLAIETKTRAVVNTDQKAYEAAKRRTAIQQKQAKSLDRIDQLEKDVKSVKDDLSKILDTLQQIVKGLK